MDRFSETFRKHTLTKKESFRNRKRKKRTLENRAWYPAGAQRGVTDMAEVKFDDLLVGVQRPHVTIQGSRNVRSEDAVISWKTYRKTYTLIGNSWEMLNSLKKLDLINFVY